MWLAAYKAKSCLHITVVCIVPAAEQKQMIVHLSADINPAE